MILKVARNLDDSGPDLFRCGHSCLDFPRIKRCRLRNPGARTEQHHEKRCPTAQTKPDEIVGPPISSNLLPVCHGSPPVSSPPINTFISLGGPDIARPDLVINAKIVNCPDYFEDAEDGLR